MKKIVLPIIYLLILILAEVLVIKDFYILIYQTIVITISILLGMNLKGGNNGFNNRT